MKQTVKQSVEEFCKNNPKAKFMLEDMNEIMELEGTISKVITSFYFGYMKGQKARKGGSKNE